MTDVSATSLRDKIAEFSKSIADRIPAAVVAALGSEVGKLAASGIAHRALQVGAKPPDFTLPDAHGKPVTLSTLLAKGPVVVTFYRGGWCPFCNLQLRAYQGVLDQIHAAGAELVAISPQTPDYTANDAETKALTFPVLSDAHNGAARAFGLVFSLTEAFRQAQTTLGSVLPTFNGDDSWELPMPGTFVIGRDGIVTLAHVDPNYMVRLEPAAILAALRGHS